MHQIRFQLGLCPRPCWGVYSAPPDPLAGFKGPTSKGGGGRGEGKGFAPPQQTALDLPRPPDPLAGIKGPCF